MVSPPCGRRAGRTGVVERASGEFPEPEVLAHRGEIVKEATVTVAFTLVSDPHHHPRRLAPVERRAAVLEELLVENGLVDPDVIDSVVETYANDLGPMNGARVVARAWVDSDYRARLLRDGTAAVGELGFGGPEGEHVVVVENAPEVHNVVVCTLCSCYPWPLFGLPPNWYKSPPYRSRVGASPGRCWPSWAASWTTTSRSGCGTQAPRPATSCCPSARRAPRVRRRTSSPRSSPETR